MSEAEMAAAAGAQYDADVRLNTPPLGPNSGSSSTAAVPPMDAPPPSMADLMGFMTKLMEMMVHDRKNMSSEKNHLANCKLDEKYFRKVPTFNNTRSGWKEWRRHFLNAVRECDVDWADMVEGLEKLDEPIDNVHAYNITQNQLSTNLYNRLIDFTTGTAFQIVESVPDHNGGEAWKLLSHQFDPKTDARLTNLVLSIIGHKIKGQGRCSRHRPVGGTTSAA